MEIGAQAQPEVLGLSDAFENLAPSKSALQLLIEKEEEDKFADKLQQKKST